MVPVGAFGWGWLSERGFNCGRTRNAGGGGRRGEKTLGNVVPYSSSKQKLEYRRSISFFVKYVKCCVAVGDVEGKKKMSPPV